MNLSTFHYFFSAWLQADAALFAIVGIFGIYKLQSLENVIQNAKLELSNVLGIADLSIARFEDGERSERKEIIQSFEKGTVPLDKLRAKKLRVWLFSMNRALKIKKWLFIPMGLFAFGMIFCGTMLLLSEHILCSPGYLAFNLMLVCLIYHFIILGIAMWFSWVSTHPFLKEAMRKAKG